MDDIKVMDVERGGVTEYDKEKQHATATEGTGYSSDSREREESVVAGEILRTHDIQNKVPILRVMRRAEEWLDRKMGIEVQGIDRIPDEKKRPPSILNAFLFWWSLNIHVGVIALGVLGPTLGLSLHDSIGAAIIGIVLGSLCTGYTGTLSPKLGLRQIAVSRYSFGFYGAKLCSVLNVIVGGGFAVVNFVVVGQILSAVSDYNLSLTVGIIIIAVISYVISFFGFRVIHTFEKYSWIPTLILFWVMYGQVAPHVNPSVPSASSGLAFAGSYLSIIAVNFSNSSGWSSTAGDYYCNYPAKTSRWLVFYLSWFGVVVPTTISVVLGSLLGNVALGNGVTGAYPPLATTYTDHGLGGLIRDVYHPLAWSKFCLIILTFSVLGNNIAIFYSSGLSIQLLGNWFHAVPRFIWSLLAAIVIAVLAIAGQQHLSTVISNFVSLLGYWTIAFTLILLLEDTLFRRRTGYDLTVWDSPKGLPWGLAAVMSLLAAYLAGGVPGMAQTWYVGPIARQFSQYGGDVGIYMSGAISLAVYPPARWLEKRYTGR